jgi:hypothetical protein
LNPEQRSNATDFGYPQACRDARPPFSFLNRECMLVQSLRMEQAACESPESDSGGKQLLEFLTWYIMIYQTAWHCSCVLSLSWREGEGFGLHILCRPLKLVLQRSISCSKKKPVWNLFDGSARHVMLVLQRSVFCGKKPVRNFFDGSARVLTSLYPDCPSCSADAGPPHA